MASLTSKYLQLPDASSCDIGKPSPLAMLAATCRKIGTSPGVSSRRVPRIPSPQPQLTPLSTTSPVSTPSSCSYLPPTPPPSPHMTSSSRALSVSPEPTELSPLPLRSVSPIIPGHQPCYYPVYQPVMRYSPYSTTPVSRPRVPPSSMSYHLATTPYSSCTPMVVPVPTFNHTLHSSSSPPMFGVYPHHDQPIHATMSSMKVHPTRNRRSRRVVVKDEEEEIIDVVSL
ncbi:flocculation protein FLO11-like [Lytechinus variegatus]|uniref:flocculation protein FLO11-like n=1 Tax=Lytechinus variegatus TaxID=7654 RepID=UPI001BB26FF6|nr:flocculation protein FLO11-like [Lytechinus variegatus]